MSSFSSALSGLRTHQSWIELIGNNLANANTPGFKGSRAVFSDLFSLTARPGSAPSGNLGGSNPLQVGLGVQLAGSDMRLSQGSLQTTGRTFDLAIVGEGLFTLTDGAQTLYTRVGTFGLDATGTLVDLSSGFRVLDPSGQLVEVDTSLVTPPNQTTEVSFAGNLPAEVTGPLAEVLTSSNSFEEGTPAMLTSGISGPFNLAAGSVFTMEISANGAAPQEVSIIGTGSMTATEIANEIQAQTTDITATVGPGQEIILTSDTIGSASSIIISPGPAGSDLQNILGLGGSAQGTQFASTLLTDMNALVSNLSPYANGDTIELNGTDADGSVVTGVFTYGTDGTTIGELVDFLSNAYPNATASFDSSTGQISLSSDETGDAAMSLILTDGSGQVGENSWAESFFNVSTDGAGPDTVTTSIEVYDIAGIPHVMTFDYVRQDDGLWSIQPTLPEEEGTITSGPISNIRFNPDGSLLSPTTAVVELQFSGQATQQIQVQLGQAGEFAGVTQFGGGSSLIAESQDGFAAGELANIAVNPDGSIEGFFSNGQTQILGQIGIAIFANPAGLQRSGQSFFRETPNSGRVLASGDQNGAGQVVSGTIEGSNVDTAEEFVALIEAQRGFQANARVISVQDEVLQEVVNIV